jgi:hypothetical protein
MLDNQCTSFINARLLEPIERRSHIEFITHRITGKRHFDAPLSPRPACLSSIPAYKPQWFDDPNFEDAINPHTGESYYVVPPNHVVPPHKRVKMDPTPPLVWDIKVKIERCYTEAIPQDWVPLGTGIEDPIEVAEAMGVLFPSPSTPQQPPPPPKNAEHYQQVSVPQEDVKTIMKTDKDGFSFGTKHFICNSTVLIPALPRNSAAKTSKGITGFQQRKKSLLLQRRWLYDIWDYVLWSTAFKNDHVDKRNHCPQCGSTSFKKTLRCGDCGWKLKETKYIDLHDRFNPATNDRLGISNENQRETNALHPNDQQERKDWSLKWQARFNPMGKKWSEVTAADIEVVENDPTFPTEVARYQTMFTGARTNEIAEGPPNTLTKRFTRTRELPTWIEATFQGTLEHNVVDDFIVVIHLNNRAEAKTIGKVTDSDAKLHRALLRCHKATEKAQLKSLRRKARVNGWTDEMLAVETQHVKERIAAAYKTPLEALEQGEGVPLSHIPV